MVIREPAICRKRIGGSRDGVLRLRIQLLLLDEAARFAAADKVLLDCHIRCIVILVVIGEREVALRWRRSALATLESVLADPPVVMLFWFCFDHVSWNLNAHLIVPCNALSSSARPRELRNKSAAACPASFPISVVAGGSTVPKNCSYLSRGRVARGLGNYSGLIYQGAPED